MSATVTRYVRALATASARSYGGRCDACGRALPDDVTGTCAGCSLGRDRHEADVAAFLAGREATYDAPSARILRDHLSGQTVWSPDRGWHDDGVTS